MKRVLACLLAVLLAFSFASAALAVSDSDASVGELAVASSELAQRLYGGDTSEVSDPALAAFINGYEGNELTFSMRSDYSYVEHYDVDMTITSERTVSVVETLDVVFNEESHGYYRYIPTYGSEELYRITNIRAEGAEALITEEADEVSIRLGSEYLTVLGSMTYTISYDIEYFSDITADGDRIYQNIFPGDLEDRVLNATARIRLPEAELLDYRLYSGSYGSRESHLECCISDGVMYLYASRSFSPHSGATVELLFPEGTFAARPADVTVTTAQFELNVESDGSYVLNQYLIAEVSEDTSSPYLPVWQSIGLEKQMDRDSSNVGVGSVRIAVAVDGLTVEAERGTTEVCVIDLSAYRGKTVTVTSVQMGQYAVKDGSFELHTVITPTAYHYRGCLVEYSDMSFTAHLPAAEGESFRSSQQITTGSASTEYFFDITETEDGFAALLNGQLPVGESVTVEISLPENAVVRSTTWLDWVTLVLSLGLVIAAAILRCQKKRQMVSTMEYYPPDDLNPAEVGYIIDGKADPKDLTSLIYYWASKGYLSIELTGNTTYTLHKLSDLATEHHPYEHMMFKRMWSLGGSNGTVTSSQLNEKYYYTLTKAMTQLKNRYSKKDRRLSDDVKEKVSNILAAAALGLSVLLPVIATVAAPAAQGTELLAPIIALIFFLPVWLLMRWKGGTIFEKKKPIVRVLVNIAAVVLSALGGVLYLLLAGSVAFSVMSCLLLCVAVPVALCLSPGIRDRSEYGAYIIGRCLGFKNFLKVAEVERLEMLLEENPEYYYNILPYAHVLGVSDIWEEKLKGLNAQPPAWFYGTDVSPTTARYLMTRNMERMNTHMRSVPIQTSTSGGNFGGFSGGGGSFGGGFSGGGGGGGGGGRW